MDKLGHVNVEVPYCDQSSYVGKTGSMQFIEKLEPQERSVAADGGCSQTGEEKPCSQGVWAGNPKG